VYIYAFGPFGMAGFIARHSGESSHVKVEIKAEKTGGDERC
jgi:hypothetical protein